MKKMFEKLKELYERHREVINYIVFGGFTTVVNIVVFFLFDTVFGWPYLHANAIAIVLSILFAYITNKLFVFETKGLSWQENIMEFLRFIGWRAVSGLADMASMWILVDLILIDPNIAKLLTQVIVVVLNYGFSKFLIFI